MSRGPASRGELDRLRRTRKQKADLAEEQAVAQVALVLADGFARSGISQREIAKRLRVSEPRVSQMLSGNGNLTTRTMARIAHTLGFRLVVKLEPL